MTLPSKTEHELEELLRRVEAHDDDGDAAYIELCAEAAAALPALLAERKRLREGIERVCNAYGDDGWARTAFVRDLRSLLAEDDQPTPEATDEQ